MLGENSTMITATKWLPTAAVASKAMPAQPEGLVPQAAPAVPKMVGSDEF